MNSIADDLVLKRWIILLSTCVPTYTSTATDMDGTLHTDFQKSETSKGQLISKKKCQVEDSSKKRTNEFVFTSMQRVFVRFLEESSARKKRFEII